MVMAADGLLQHLLVYDLNEPVSTMLLLIELSLLRLPTVVVEPPIV